MFTEDDFAKGDEVLIKRDARTSTITLKAPCITAWNDDGVVIDLRGQTGRVLHVTNGWVCIEVIIAGCIIVTTYQLPENLLPIMKKDNI